LHGLVPGSQGEVAFDSFKGLEAFRFRRGLNDVLAATMQAPS